MHNIKNRSCDLGVPFPVIGAKPYFQEHVSYQLEQANRSSVAVSSAASIKCHYPLNSDRKTADIRVLVCILKHVYAFCRMIRTKTSHLLCYILVVEAR
jgi:hypothetical protein